MEFKDTKTFANLMSGFAGESQARTKYNIYAKQAEKQGYVEMKDIFNEIADNEMAHAKIFLKYIHQGEIPDTLRNIEDSAGGEHYEWTDVYSGFAKQADEEGFAEIANKFRLIAKIEQEHEQKYKTLINNIVAKQVFKKSKSVSWVCTHCGHTHQGDQAPEKCPVCTHPQAFFKEKC